MKVSELIEALQKLPQDSLVVMSKDAEGNNYSPFSDCDERFYIADSTWSGELCEEGDGGVPCVVLWPIN